MCSEIARENVPKWTCQVSREGGRGGTITRKPLTEQKKVLVLENPRLAGMEVRIKQGWGGEEGWVRHGGLLGRKSLASGVRRPSPERQNMSGTFEDESKRKTQEKENAFGDTPRRGQMCREGVV